MGIAIASGVIAIGRRSGPGSVDHRDHVGLIRAGVDPAATGRRWLELGAGDGAFTLALADLLGAGATITALDRDASALRRLTDELARRFPDRALRTIVGDFREPLPAGPFDGLLAANSLISSPTRSTFSSVPRPCSDRVAA